MARISLSCGSRRYAWLLAITALLGLAGCASQDTLPLAAASPAATNLLVPTHSAMAIIPPKTITTVAATVAPQPQPTITQPIVLEKPRPLAAWRSAYITAARPLLYVINADGSGETLLTSNTVDLYPTQLEWSPDGRWLAFVSQNSNAQSRIVKIQPDGRNLAYLTSDLALNMIPTWSRDGQWIAFSSTPSINSQSETTYMMRADGSDRIPIDLHDLGTINAFRPTAKNGRFLLGGAGLFSATERIYEPLHGGDDIWSPDLRQLAFVSDRDGNWEIYVVNADGSGRTRLTQHPADDDFPIWSPDGQQIAFLSKRDGKRQLYVMDVDGSSQTRLSTVAYAEAPAWSPDGQYIGFNSDEGLVIVSADGREQRILRMNIAEFAWAPQ